MQMSLLGQKNIMKNKEIPSAWKRNIAAKNHNNSFSTNGIDLYSYQQLIGTTSTCGAKILYNYTSNAGCFISNTTSTHVGYAKPFSDEMVHPNSLVN